MSRKEYMKQYNKEYRSKMKKETKKNYQKKYYQKNKDRVKQRVLKYYTENKEKRIQIARNCHLKRVFGISQKDYEIMLRKQGGVCDICKNPKKESGINLAVDHCHKSKKIRGILCHKCNHGIGYFNDNIELLKKAIIYLKKHVLK